MMLMMNIFFVAFVMAVAVFATNVVTAFTVIHPTTTTRRTTTTATTTSSLDAFIDPTEFVSTAAATVSGSGFWISTIDSDIANIPTNEFAQVFAGGIVSCCCCCFLLLECLSFGFVVVWSAIVIWLLRSSSFFQFVLARV
jgi:uncharacterized membrane protein